MPARTDARRRILEAAGARFFAHGFSRVRMDDLAEELGISKKTLYAHFPSKEALLQAVMRGMMREIAERVDDLTADRTMDFVEKLRTLMTFIGSRLARISRPFAEDLRRHAPELWREIEEFRSRKILGNFNRLFQEGMDRGVFRSDIHPRVLIMTYYHAIQNLVTPEFFAQVPLSAQQIFDTILQIIFEGILTHPARSRYARRTGKVPAAKTRRKQ
jgi:AcrR family transcriptional regulator